jgi:hypothetical protein
MSGFIHSTALAQVKGNSPAGTLWFGRFLGANPLKAHFVMSPTISNATGGAQSATGILTAAPVHSPSSRLEIIA